MFVAVYSNRFYIPSAESQGVTRNSQVRLLYMNLFLLPVLYLLN